MIKDRVCTDDIIFSVGKDGEPNHHTPPLDVEAASKVPAHQMLQEVIKIDNEQVQQQSSRNSKHRSRTARRGLTPRPKRLKFGVDNMNELLTLLE